ncbi:MAG: hypothetical protein ABSG01_02895 [Anaerolineales bacterium]|jgi:hypothetical protein
MKMKWRNILIAMGLIVAVVLLVDFNRRMEELDRLSTQLNSVRAEATAIIQTQTALAGQVAFATSDVAVEQWAYDNKMVRPGEHPVSVVPGAETTPTPVATVTPAGGDVPIWRIWWELFFGNHQ